MSDDFHPSSDSSAEAMLHREQSAVVLIEPCQESGFRKRLEKLNKKAAAFGLQPIVIRKESMAAYERVTRAIGHSDKLETYLKPLAKGSTCLHPVQLKRFEIEFPIIQLGNWRVVGKIEAFGEGALQFQVTEESRDTKAIADFASRPIACQHCNTKRRRKDGFVLRDLVNGAHKQVGGSCLQDFTGIDPAAALFLAKMWEVVRIEEGEFGEYLASGRSNAVNTREYLAGVCFLASTTGFVSAAKSRDLGISATYDDAIGLNRALQDDAKLRSEYLAARDRHLATADAIRAWAAELPATSSYNTNLQLLLKNDTLALNPKHLAFAAASWAMYQKAHAQEHETAVSRHIGEPGQKMTRHLVVRRTVPMEGPYGLSILVLMRDEEGNHLTWKTSACPNKLMENEGNLRIEASFKVKDHASYKGTCQTAVTHLKVLAIA